VISLGALGGGGDGGAGFGAGISSTARGALDVGAVTSGAERRGGATPRVVCGTAAGTGTGSGSGDGRG
jgi:hypothetical protein